MKNKFFYAILLLVAINASGFTYFFMSAKKIAYVNLGELYQNFKMAQEQEQELKGTSNKQQALLDSLERSINACTMKLSEEKNPEPEKISQLNMMKEHYYKTYEKINEARTYQEEEARKKIWMRLNQYVKDYGKENDYAYIYGAEGSGNIMYADEAENITAEVKTFINQKYNGKK